MNLEVANKLYKLRKKNGLSQEQLAEKLGISRQSVSKWERAESCPDTDNLVALAKLYNVSLDELLLSGDENGETGPSAETDTNGDMNEAPDVGHKFINVNDGDNIVHVGTKGVFVKDDEGNEVRVGLKGVYVNGEKKKAGHIHELRRSDSEPKQKKNAFLKFPYPILTVIIYLLLGFFFPAWGWSCGWIIFLTIPLYYTAVEAIIKKDANIFCYPVLAVCVFLGLGMFLSLWHPAWILFLTIPLYYAIVNSFKN